MPSVCPTCQASYPDTLTYCPRDGAQLQREAGSTLDALDALLAAPPAVAPQAVPVPTPRRGGALVGALAALVVVLGGTVAFLALRPQPEVMASAPKGQAFGGEASAVPLEVAARRPSPAPARELVAATPARSAASYGPARVETDGAGLILRDGPGRDHSVVAKMLPGDVVTVDGCEGGAPGRRWCTVVYGGVRGWASDEFLDIGGPARDTDSGLEEAFAAAEPVGQGGFVDGAKVSFVRLRAEPTVGGEVLVKMASGTGVWIGRCLPYGWSLGGRAIDGRWCFITAEHDGRTLSGWASDGALAW